MNISGRMKVKSLKKEFNAEFGLVIRVYDGNKFADDDATIASLRKGGEIKGEFSPQKNMKVGSFEDRMKADFGLKIQIAGSDDSYLCSDTLTLSKALENDKKRIEKRSKQNNDSEDVNETKIRSTIERTQKKGLEPGPMKGIWEGSLIENKQTAENKSESFDQNDDNPIKDYLIKNSGKDFTLYMYTRFVKDYLGKLDLIDNDDTQKKLESINNDLIELYNSNPDLYGGAVYVFQTIVKNVSNDNICLDFDYEEIQKHGYSLDRLQEEGTPVKLVCHDYPEEIFKNVFLTKMIFTLLTVVEETDDIEFIAELIVGSNMNQFTNSETEDAMDGDWISDMVIDILDILGFDLYNYEGESEIYGRYFLDSGLSMGFDYNQLAREFWQKYC